MIDLPNKIDNNFESNETTFENNIENAKISILNIENSTDDNLVKLDNTTDINNEIFKDVSENDLKTLDTTSVEDSIEDCVEDSVEDSVENSTEDSIEDSEILEDNSEISNCLALTVKKDYNLSVVKNVVVRTFKGIWKVAISIFTLNIIKFFF